MEWAASRAAVFIQRPGVRTPPSVKNKKDEKHSEPYPAPQSPFRASEVTIMTLYRRAGQPVGTCEESSAALS